MWIIDLLLAAGSIVTFIVFYIGTLDVDKSVKGTQSLKEVLSKVTKDTK
jgi:hypothetical protein